MTKEEFTLEKIQIDKERDEKYTSLCSKYATIHNPYKVGDIVKDHVGSVKIEKISFTIQYGTNIPYCIYFGLELKKDLTPRKGLSKRSVHQINVQL